MTGPPSSSALTHNELLTLQGLLAKLGNHGLNNNVPSNIIPTVQLSNSNPTPVAFYSNPTLAHVTGLPATKEPEEEKYRRRLIESQTTSAADKKRKNILKVRWSLQDEIAKLFNRPLEVALRRRKEGVSCSISPCHKEDGDYLCTNVVERWHELRKTRLYRGPTDAGLTVRRNIMLLDTTGMIERCVVCGPGFLMFKLSMKWIAKSIYKMVKDGIGFGLVQADDYERLRTLCTTVVNLLDEAKIRCKAVLLGQAGKADEWTAEELEHTAEALGYGAVKYAVLKNNRLTKCTINFDEMLNEKGNTVVYLHYTHAQIYSIITKYRRDIKKLKKLQGEMVEELIFKNNEERELGLHLLRFTEVLGEVFTILMPHILCEYMYDLCKKFHSFYSCVCQVVGYGDKTSKLLLCRATEMVMRKCFHLLGITPIYKKILKLRPGSELSKRLYFSDLTEQQLMELFCKGPCFRFDLCKVVLTHNIDASIENGSSYNKLLLSGIIQAETDISDGCFNILNRNFDDPLVITKPGSLSPHDICYCSLSVSTFVKITARLYGTTYKGDGMESYSDYRKYYPDKENDAEYISGLKEFLMTGIFPTREIEGVYLDDDAFDVCNGNVFINFSEYFANRPNGGGSGSCKLKGNDGYLDLYYVALKYAIEAALEVSFVAKETKVFGRVMAYYGQNFCYDCPASKRYLYNAMLFEIKQPSHTEPGKINLA